MSTIADGDSEGDNKKGIEYLIKLLKPLNDFIDAIGAKIFSFAAIVLSGIYLIFLANYCHKMDIPFFDFMSTTGIYSYVFVIFSAFMYAALVSYYVIPAAYIEKINNIIPDKKWLSALVIFTPPFLVWTIIVFVSVTQIRIVSLLVASVLFLLIVVSYILFLYEKIKDKKLDIIYCAGSLIIPQMLVTSFFSISMLHFIFSEGYSPGNAVIYTITVLIFIIIPAAISIVSYLAAKRMGIKEMVLFSIFLVFVLTVAFATSSMDKLLGYFNVGGDQKVVIRFRIGAVPIFALSENSEDGFALATLPVRLRFITPSTAYIKSDTPNINVGVMSLNLAYVTSIQTCKNQKENAPCD